MKCLFLKNFIQFHYLLLDLCQETVKFLLADSQNFLLAISFYEVMNASSNSNSWNWEQIGNISQNSVNFVNFWHFLSTLLWLMFCLQRIRLRWDYKCNSFWTVIKTVGIVLYDFLQFFKVQVHFKAFCDLFDFFFVLF